MQKRHLNCNFKSVILKALDAKFRGVKRLEGKGSLDSDQK